MIFRPPLEVSAGPLGPEPIALPPSEVLYRPAGRGGPLLGSPSLSWDTSNRRADLPSDWEERRQEVLHDAEGVCEIRWAGCLGWATDVDHIERGNDHSKRNLRAACKSCHGKKSSAEGVAQRTKLRAMRRRPPERHPGSR
ncbi:HNH endonuclease [Mycobacteroides abscessus]|uniref:HNH endonuclease n=1 Tax=Mycobacteroides abscessus TaxID=36809 RepID=UPI0009C99FFE|nr:HNH endonuclease [Mycobacteroides abscessus]SLK64843.1 Uncharacterised protein [Mycobacteroides abscessus subsp. abscessus]